MKSENTKEMKIAPVMISFLAAVALSINGAAAEPLQDFCVADLNSSARVNGFPCIDSKQAQASHFSFSGLNVAQNTANAVGSAVTPVFVAQLPGLNTLGVSLARIDYAPKGVVPPHTHPRASEIITILEGTLNVGFITSNPENRLISKTLQKGDAFVFPEGLVHFVQNVGTGSAVSISALSSENPGVILVANSVFGSTPPIANDLLAKAFQTDKAVIDQLQAKF